MATFALNFHFFGDSPFSFKLTNLAIHMANSMLVYLLARQLWRRLGFDTRSARSLIPALWITAIWAFHPINLTPVLFVVQRMTSLSALFMLAALTLYLYGRQAKNIPGFVAIATSLLLCWPAAILSKETGLLLPLYVFLIEWLVLGTFSTVSTKVKWLTLLLLGAAVIWVCWAKWGFITAGYSVRDFNLRERLLTETRVLWFYVRQMLLPTPEVFALFHDDIAISRGLLQPASTLLAMAGWLAVVALALQQRARRPLFAFAVFWFLTSHLLESSFFPLEIAYEHRNYMAFLGLLVWLASLLFSDQKKPTWLVPRLVLAGSFVVFCGLVTSLRSLQWADEFHRTQIEVSDHPGSARANYQAATVAMQRTYESGGGGPMAYHMVQYHFKLAARLDANSKAPLMGLLYLDCTAGVPKNVETLVQLQERFATGRFTFGDRAVVQSLSGLLVENRLCLGDHEVTALINAALSNPSADGPIRGMIYAVAMDHAAAKMHDTPLALAYARAAVASDPGSVALRVNLIHLYIQSNQVEQAQQEYAGLMTRKVAAKDQASVNELKNLFETMEKNANGRQKTG
ncbi:tetratricopeptide repeat protein [Rhodoferax sp.]|uniref:tetratricopeptide repeat protein n=1 Tax=Rhodoferax sp. TaxID=50421 RepID=UPI002613A29F|nr:tetratricopeptide repeat protein [Rhodoferax sp.]MDD2920291.1 hypothetical protein [Rhodoferax sp.]